jgi:hypothetical protein
MKKRMLAAIAASLSLMMIFACSQEKLSGVWFVEEGESHFREIIQSVHFEGEVTYKPLVNGHGQITFSQSNGKSVGLHFISSDTVTFLAPVEYLICEITSGLNYRLENSQFTLSYQGNDVLSVRCELTDKLTLFRTDGKKVVFRKSKTFK